MHLAAGIFLLRVVHECMAVSLQRSIAIGRVRIESTARLDGDVSRLLHRGDGKVLHGLCHNRPLTAHPCDDRGPVFVIVATARLALLAAMTRPASQGLFSSPFCLPLVAGGVIEFI